MARLVKAVLEFNTWWFSPQNDFWCFRLVAINTALTHCYKLVSFLNLIIIIIDLGSSSMAIRTLLQKWCLLKPTAKIWMKIDPYYHRQNVDQKI